MVTSPTEVSDSKALSTREMAKRLRRSVKEGQDWPTALLQAMGEWTDADEIYQGRRYAYFIGGEAFDWLALAERLCQSLNGLITKDEKEDLLFGGSFPEPLEPTRFKELLGTEKYRGYLNYFYGVAIEEALQLAVEREVHKRHVSNGNHHQHDFSDEAYKRIYRETAGTLLAKFREDKGHPHPDPLSLTESREFTYWLFKYRLKMSDQARVASDTRKGLKQLRQMIATSRMKVSHYLVDELDGT